MASRWPLIDTFIAAREQHYSNLALQAAPFQPGEVYIKQEGGMPATEMGALGEYHRHERRMPAPQMAAPGGQDMHQGNMLLMKLPGVLINGVRKMPVARMLPPKEFALQYPPERMTREEYALYYPFESAKRDEEEEKAAAEAAMIMEKSAEAGSAELESVEEDDDDLDTVIYESEDDDDLDTDMEESEDEEDSDSDESEIESVEYAVNNIGEVEIDGEIYIPRKRFVAIFRAFEAALQGMEDAANAYNTPD